MIIKSRLGFRGIFIVECFDNQGNLKWREVAGNLVVNDGLDHALDVIFAGATQIDPWYLGLKNAGAVAASDTLSSHAGWTEFTDYTGNRKTFNENAPSGQSIDNVGNPASFSINNTGTVSGALLASVASGTVGILFCAVNFATPRDVISGDTVNVTYTLTTGDDGV